MHINYGFLKKMIPDIKNIYFNIDEPFLNKKITKYMMDIYSFYISNFMKTAHTFQASAMTSCVWGLDYKELRK